MTSTGSYMLRETLISIVINVALSLAFFLLVFGRTHPVPVWGSGNLVFDFIPQAFMIALMSTLVPGWLTRRRVHAGLVSPLARSSGLPASLPWRAVLLAVLAVMFGAGSMAVLFRILEASAVSWTTALSTKLVFGGVLAAIVTPLGLHAALRASR